MDLRDNDVGRKNKFNLSLLNCADAAFGQRFIFDLFGALVSVSVCSQSDFVPLFLLPKKCEAYKERLEEIAREFEYDIQNNAHLDTVIPPSITKYFALCNECTFDDDEAMKIENDIGRYKKLKKKTEEEEKEFIAKVGVNTSICKYSRVELNRETTHCPVCNCLDYANGQMIECSYCLKWYHYAKKRADGVKVGCVERRYSLAYYQTHRFKCDRCKDKLIFIFCVLYFVHCNGSLHSLLCNSLQCTLC